MDYRRGTTNTLNVDPFIRSENSKVRYTGSIGDFDIYVYNDTYINDNGVENKLLPSKTVILGSKTGLEGTRFYSAIHDEKANWTATRYFTKSWEKKTRVCAGIAIGSAGGSLSSECFTLCNHWLGGSHAYQSIDYVGRVCRKRGSCRSGMRLNDADATHLIDLGFA